jgi:hypothetical protein
MQCMYIHTEWVHYAMYVYTYRQNPLYNVYINIQTESIIQCMYIHTDRIDYIMCVYTYRQNPLYNVCIYIQTGSIIQCKYTVFTLNFLRHSASLILQAHQKKCIPTYWKRYYYTPAPRRMRGYTVLPLSVRPRYFSSHFSQ